MVDFIVGCLYPDCISLLISYRYHKPATRNVTIILNGDLRRGDHKSRKLCIGIKSGCLVYGMQWAITL